jgi:hypothetical protein
MLRRACLALGLALLAGGVVAGLGNPRLTMVNTGLQVEYPRAQALALLGAALGLALTAWALPRSWTKTRWIAWAAALFAATAGVGRAYYRLEAAEAGLSDRRLLGSTRIDWSEVRRVDNGAALVLVWGGGDSQVRVETTGLTPDQRAMLDRTISRHVREAQEKAERARAGGPSGPQRQ